jgi:hypothetical protein
MRDWELDGALGPSSLSSNLSPLPLGDLGTAGGFRLREYEVRENVLYPLYSRSARPGLRTVLSATRQ